MSSNIRRAAFDGTRSFRHLADARDYLTRRERRPDATSWVKRDSRSSIEAIEAFERAYNNLGLRRFDCRRVHGRLPHLDMWPTRISVAMDFTVHRPVVGDKDSFGGAILLFNRGEVSPRVRVERCKTIAGLIYTHCARLMTALGNPDPALCLAVDVFNGVGHAPQGTFTRKLRNVADACDEIAARWGGVRPPSDYDGPDLD
jgi:DNA-directed RNA polymerase subunit N (RpoN/RPB10)